MRTTFKSLHIWRYHGYRAFTSQNIKLIRLYTTAVNNVTYRYCNVWCHFFGGSYLPLFVDFLMLSMYKLHFYTRSDMQNDIYDKG